MPFTYEYPRAAITADAIVFAGKSPFISVLLIERLHEPFKGMWALPGGFMDMDEEIDQSVKRELEEETGLVLDDLQQLHVFSKVNRDPRHRTITVAFYGFVGNEMAVSGGDDAAKAQWFQLSELPPLAFDHAHIIQFAIAKLGIQV